MKATVKDKLFITEILNDLYRNGFRPGGKAEEMLKAWSGELRERTRDCFPASRLRRFHARTCGPENW